MSDAAVRVMQEMSWQLSTCATMAELECAATQWLFEQALPSEFCALHEFTPTDIGLRLCVYPNFEEADVVREAVLDHVAAGETDHPLIRHHFSPPYPVTPARLSDFVSDRQLRQTSSYAELLSKWAVNHQLALIHRPGTGAADFGAYALLRTHRDYTDDELNLAIGLQPVLLALHTALRCRPTAPAPGPAAEGLRLTTAELDVLNLLAAGLTAVAIAHIRRVSARTVRKQLESIYAKLGCHDRMLAVREAAALGLIQPAPARLGRQPRLLA